MLSDEDTTLVHAVQKQYASLNLKLPAGTFTILAAIALTSSDSSSVQPKIIGLATGCKCLPKDKLPLQGEAVHDSHAEVLARRCALRWLIEEISRAASASDGSHRRSAWISKMADDRYRLKDGVYMIMYISTLPCGDASMRFLATFQDEEMAALKDSAVFPPLAPNVASRGRDNYSLLGVLRTKPGRADSPQTLSLSCSDKIARWNVLGIQGALGSAFFHPIYLKKIIIGEVPPDLHDVVKSDCERALWGRLQGIYGLPEGYELNRPEIQFTSIGFVHSRSAQEHSSLAQRSCNESLTWVADSTSPYEVLINGLKRGVSPKHRHKSIFWPTLSKVSLFHLYRETRSIENLPLESKTMSYYQAKESMTQYQMAKNCLLGEGRPFSGWIRSGARWENFSSSSDNRQQSTDITN
ncbi:adenosine deaminase/editase [Suillus bovinus]|uniref:adenosine deaminase/editase n=1 Tax=Suillus bovinus TaxID=48563 RepID=UPI001B880270|nr:adenosine deaminase/editase [Suillus bovinus]KAG2159030.1 adenosine deaminase/editase [Suillus bovinus]